MKTLIVKYTPRNEKSMANKLLKVFCNGIINSEIEELDLCKDVPDFFTTKSIEAYYIRNLMGQPLSVEESQSLEKMHRMTAQLKSADIVVVAFPMFNFSIPASMKAWFDSVLHVGETVDPRGGVYRGLMTGKKALALVAAGGIYSEGNGVGPYFGPAWEHAISLATLEFQFMGYSDVRGVIAEGMALSEEIRAERLQKAFDQTKAIAAEWYN